MAVDVCQVKAEPFALAAWGDGQLEAIVDTLRGGSTAAANCATLVEVRWIV
jgi:hypothetical protein